jgi:hypothetical protein
MKKRGQAVKRRRFYICDPGNRGGGNTIYFLSRRGSGFCCSI